MMIGIRAYASIAVLIILVGTGVFAKHLCNQNQKLKEANEVMELQIEKNASNLKLLVQQLDRETEYRQIVETTLNELIEDVPDVIYSQKLPPEIQATLDRFHTRIGR